MEEIDRACSGNIINRPVKILPHNFFLSITFCSILPFPHVGFFCQGGAETPNPVNVIIDHDTSNDICPSGYYCPEGTIYPIPCPQGTYSAKNMLKDVSACESCPAGIGSPNTVLVL